MFQSFNVSVEELRTHAATVDQLAARMRQATDTADPSSLSTEAFGIFGSFLAQFILQIAGKSQDGLGNAADSIMDMCNGIKQVADLYENVDLDNAFGFQGKGRA
jgi:hypothetical protein